MTPPNRRCGPDLCRSLVLGLVLAIVTNHAVSAASQRPERLTLYCELDQQEVLPFFQNQTTLAALQKLNATVSLGMRDLSDERAAAAAAIHAAGIPVVAWMLVPMDQGYWENMDNARNVSSRIDAWHAWTIAHNLTWAAVGLDLEIDHRDEVDVGKGDWGPVIARLLTRTDQRLVFVRGVYADIVARVRGWGYRLRSYTLPLVYDDRAVGTTLMQRLSGLIDIGRDAVDIEAPMLYSTEFPFGLGVLAQYSEGTSANGIGLGSTGGPGQIGSGLYANWTMLEQDLLYAVARTRNIFVYSLEGCVEHGYLQLMVAMDWSQPLRSDYVAAMEKQARVVKVARGVIQFLLKTFNGTHAALPPPMAMTDSGAGHGPSLDPAVMEVLPLLLQGDVVGASRAGAKLRDHQV